MTSRAHKARVTKADLDRVLDFLRSMGVKLASVEVHPGRVKITTTDGVNLTLPEDEEILDQGVREFIAQHGHG